MTLHRFFLPPDSFQSSSVLFPPETVHQIRNVLRLRDKDMVIALDGRGQEFVVRLWVNRQEVRGRVSEQRASPGEPRVLLTIYQGLLKGPRFEPMLQKCTEIGASRFVPVQTSRSTVSEPGKSKERRFQAIIREAAEQSERGKVPVLAQAMSFGEALTEARAAGPTILFWEEERAQRLRDVTLSHESERVGIFIGPEGGFSGDESEQARRSGAHVLSLGNRVLRAETAAMIAAGLVLEKLGELA